VQKPLGRVPRLLFFPVRGSNMQRVNEFNFYDLATQIHPLTEIGTSEVKYGDVFFQWFQARDALNQMFRQRPLTVSLSAANELYDSITEFVPEKWPEAIGRLGTPEDRDMEGWEVSKISEAAKKFETVLAAECQVLDTYFVSKKGAYSTADLVERAHICFGAMAAKLPDQAKSDFDQAGKCMAFDLPTACAFHIVRGSEAVIRKYYEQVTGKAPKVKMRNWGAYIKLLRENKADEKVTVFLDHIRNSYRNPVLHPEESVDADQAVILFGACVSLVTLMISEIDRLSAKSAAPLPFPPVTAVLTLPEAKTPAETPSAVKTGTDESK